MSTLCISAQRVDLRFAADGSTLPRMELDRRNMSHTCVPGSPAWIAPPPKPAAEAVIRAKLTEYRRMCQERDRLILEAKKGGFSEVAIAELSGHSRNTVRSVLKSHGIS
ncbi:hypothetical protein [Streptomyces sp. YIM S03343]